MEKVRSNGPCRPVFVSERIRINSGFAYPVANIAHDSKMADASLYHYPSPLAGFENLEPLSECVCPRNESALIVN
jgi:hypothetical protein